MSMSFDRRKRSCVYQIDGGFETDKTVAWMMKEFADDENIKRVQFPEKLCRNIVTIGGTGKEREINFAAFEAAFRQIQTRDREAMRKQLDEARVKESELRNKVEDLQDEVRQLERESSNLRILQLQEGVPA